MTDAFPAGAFPAGACDTHVHVYDHRYPIAPESKLRPPDASVSDYRAVQAALGLSRVVLVQPTTYGLDNSCQLAAAAELGATARVVVVVDDAVTEGELARLSGLGARGARFHQLPGGALPWSMLPDVAARIAPFGWHVQLQTNGRDLAEQIDALLALPVPLVIDHVGRFMPPVAPDGEPFALLRRLLDAGRCWVKLSAPYESEHDDTHVYREVGRLVRVLVAHHPECLLWATNWPHPGQTAPPSTEDLRRLAFEWLPDDATRRRVLVDNPAKLYLFDAPREGLDPS